MEREGGNGERIRKWRDIHFLHFLIFSLFPPSLSISYIKNCDILWQNVKNGTFVANVAKNLTYALWENYSESNSLRGSSASCTGLPRGKASLSSLSASGVKSIHHLVKSRSFSTRPSRTTNCVQCSNLPFAALDCRLLVAVCWRPIPDGFELEVG